MGELARLDRSYQWNFGKLFAHFMGENTREVEEE
jgi:hypothetical protein